MSSRRGAVLIIVVGLSAMLVSLALAYLARARADASETSALLADAQARVMLHAALMYIQEGSRIGWSSAAKETAPVNGSGWREGTSFDALGQRSVSSLPSGVIDAGGEAYGWTDVRNGWLGPIGPRYISAGSPGDGHIPEPGWWSGYRPFPEDGQLGTATWPMPGSVLRVAMDVPEVPPYAVSMTTTPNPFFPIELHNYGTSAWNTSWNSTWYVDANTQIWAPIWGSPQMQGLLYPQPVMDRWDGSGNQDFRTGRLVDPSNPASGTLWRERTQQRAWFRIYREKLGDHDGDGAPYYDRVRISQRLAGGSHVAKNWNVFIVAAGAGATMGFRNWAEVTAANRTALFGDEAFFDELRRTEAIQWWRVEWTAITGGWDSEFYEATWYNGDWNENLRRSMAKSQRWAHPRTFGGNFKWVQRLDPPADWIRNGEW